MKKKILTVILAIVCALSLATGLSACKKKAPEGGAWWAQAKVSGGTATLTFTSDTEWKLDCKGAFLKDEWNPWQNGTYKFDGKAGQSTLHMTATKESPNTFIKDKAVGEEATYEPEDGVYKIVFDVNGSDTVFSFKPPQDGTKPDGSSVPEGCTNHVDNNCDGVCDNEGCGESVAINHVDTTGDGKCDKCGNDMPAQAEKTLQLELKTDALGGGSINLYSDNTFDLNLTYGGKILEGTWASSDASNPASPLTLTVDKSTILGGGNVSPVGDTMTVIIDASAYPVITYTCTTDYDASAGGMGTISMTFTGSIGGQPAPHECGHVCATCGKCTDATCTDAACAEKCQGHEPAVEKTVKFEVEAPVYAETMMATLKVYEDGSWEVFFSGDSWCNGTWSLNESTNALTVVRTNTESGVTLVGAENETVVYQLTNGAYTITMNFPSKDGVVFTINVGGEAAHQCKHVCVLCGKCTDTTCTDEACEEKCAGHGAVQSTLAGTSNAGQPAKIELMSDNTWAFYIDFWQGYSFVCGGTWALNAEYNIILTPVNDEAHTLAESSYTLAVDYETHDYSISGLEATIPQVGKLTFNLSTKTITAEHFTVTFDLNYTNAPAGGTATTETFDAGNDVTKEYVKAAPAVPTREEYKFAGWYTVANPTLSNGASSTEYLFGTKLSAYNSAPASIKNDVCEITSDATLYARWVQVVEIADAAGLRAMANDLTGSYKLTADITLTGEWAPIGGYYASYEFYEPTWWVYSFRGELDGNGHKITGLNITTLTATEDAISATEGSKSGTSALLICLHVVLLPTKYL